MSSDYEVRFGALGRLYGRFALERFKQAHVAVVGLGGVGSWTVEALARSGIGHLTLIDFDEVCLSNINRQLHATGATIGRGKAAVLAERIAAIAPDCTVRVEASFFTEANAAHLLGQGFDTVVDAIDVTRHKCLLIAATRSRGLPLVSCGGAGGRIDPSRIRVDDLARTRNDPLLAQLRKRLRTQYGFPADPGKAFGVDCVYSDELPVYPRTDGSVSPRRESGADYRLNCDAGFGSATHVTGTFGFSMAGAVLSGLSTRD